MSVTTHPNVFERCLEQFHHASFATRSSLTLRCIRPAHPTVITVDHRIYDIVKPCFPCRGIAPFDQCQVQNLGCCRVGDPVVASTAGESSCRHMVKGGEEFFNEYLRDGGLLGSKSCGSDSRHADQRGGLASSSSSKINGKVRHGAIGVPNCPIR